MDAKLPVNPVEILTDEHRILLKKLGNLRQSVRDIQGAISAEAIQKLVADLLFFFNSEMANHVEKEEKLLFPAFEKAVSGDKGVLDPYKSVHYDLGADMDKTINTLRSLTQELKDKPLSEAIPHLKELDETISLILKRWAYHTKMEEKHLFPETERLLSKEILHNVGKQMRQMGPAVKSH